MLTVTPGFKDKIKAPQRQLKPLLEVDFRPDEAVFVVGATASSSFSPETQPSNVTQMLFRPQTWIGTGPYIYNVRKNEGWQSAGVSDANGYMQELLTVTYSKAHAIDALYLISYPGYFPKDFIVEARVNGVWQQIYSQTDGISPMIGMRLNEEVKADALRLTISRIPTAANRVKILTFGFPHKILLAQDDLEDFKLLEESAGESASPIGSVTSNEFSVGIRNDHRWFTPANSESPFQKFLRPGVRLRPYLGLETAPNSYEIVSLGTFNTVDWEVGVESLTAALVGFDKIHILNSRPPVKVPVIFNATIRGLFDLLFRSYGLNATEYEIDESLNQPVPVGWVPKGQFSDAAQELSEAGNCSVLVTRSDKIVVKNNFVMPEPVEHITDEDMLKSLGNPVSFLKTYNAVKVKYKIPTLKDGQELLSLKDLSFPPGITRLKDIEFQSGPVARISSIRLSTPPGTLHVRNISNGAWYVDLEIENTSWETVTGNLSIEGTQVDLINTEFISKRAGVPAHTLRIFDLESDLIQDAQVAKIYALAMRTVLEHPALMYKADTRGNPTYELMDTLTVESAIDGIVAADIILTKVELTYDGGIEAQIEGRRPILPTQRVFFDTGFWVEVPLPITESYYK